MKLDTIQRANLNKELVKLGDILATCEPGSGEFKEYNREYRKVAKLLYPEMYKSNIQRKPSRGFIGSLKHCTCGCGTVKLRKVDGKSQFSCSNCDRHSELCNTQPLARDSWNLTFKLNNNE